MSTHLDDARDALAAADRLNANGTLHIRDAIRALIQEIEALRNALGAGQLHTKDPA
jgi:hypothetical protein